jgi:hypothetical protein
VKPIEETWIADDCAGLYLRTLTGEGRLDVENMPGLGEFWNADDMTPEATAIDAARAKLAAEAPLMARMLLAKEWSDDGTCDECGGWEHPEASPSDEVVGHRVDCAWLKLMRRLGERS